MNATGVNVFKVGETAVYTCAVIVAIVSTGMITISLVLTNAEKASRVLLAMGIIWAKLIFATAFPDKSIVGPKLESPIAEDPKPTNAGKPGSPVVASELSVCGVPDAY